MPLTFYYYDPFGVDEPAAFVDQGSSVVRFGRVNLGQSAEIGEAAISGLEIDDPAGSLTFAGLRTFVITESSAPSNNQVVWAGMIQDKTVSRGPFRTGTSRQWSLDLSDYNWRLGIQIITDADGNRPAETAGDRLRWLMTATHNHFHDYGHVTYPTNAMDACDYRSQRQIDVLADIVAISGYNFWLDWNQAHNAAELFFMSPSSTSYASTLAISNDLADVDSTTTFAPSEDAELRRSPTRIAYGVYLPYANGAVYRTNATTGLQFARVDQSAPMSNVKTAAKANAVADRLLATSNEEDDRISCSIVVPAANVNDLRHGQTVAVKFTHLPGYESPVLMRALRRTVVQEEEVGQDAYRIALELSPVGASVIACSTSLLAAPTVSIDNQDYVAPGVVSYPITPTAGNDYALVGAVMVTNSNVPAATGITGTGGWTTDYSQNVLGGEHPGGAMLYKAITNASGAYNVTASYTPGFGPSSGAEHWAVVATAIRTSATSPVQSKGAVGTSQQTVTLTSAPTAGNMLVMMVVQRGSTDPLWPTNAGTPALYPTTGWTLLGQAYTTTDLVGGYDKVCLVARCVQGGDGAVYGGGVLGSGTSAVVNVEEWSIA